MTIEVNIVKAFTKNGEGGNPAGVVLDAERYTTAQKQEIALKAGLSETAFISSSSVADFKLEFFTPSRQIAHCGHATIASFYFLKELGLTGDRAKLVKETIDGTREIHFIEGEVYMQQKAPVISYPEGADIDEIFGSLGLEPQQPLPKIINTGNSFILLEVASEKMLAVLQPDFESIAALSDKYNAVGYYIFCRAEGEIDATVRMFAPSYGINEEAATGMAAGPLAGYLYGFVKQKKEYVFEQGRFMEPPSASLIKVKAEIKDNKITSLFAGGKATLLKQMKFDI